MKSNIKLSGFADEIAQDLTTQIRVIKKLGMSYIEMRGVDGDNLIFQENEKVAEIKRRLDDAGIKLSALGTPIGKIGLDEDFEPHFEAYKRAVEIAHKMDCFNLRMFSFYLPKGCNPSMCESIVFEQMGRMVDYAAKNDAVLLHENEKGIYGEKAPECRKLLETFGGEHFKGIFDFANFVQVKQDTLEAYELLKEYIVYIHVKDAIWEDGSVVPAGRGDGNVEKILAQLVKNGFEGFLSIEPHLFDFQGFDALEKGEKKAAEGRKLTGEEAFTLAHTSLMQILDRI